MKNVLLYFFMILFSTVQLSFINLPAENENKTGKTECIFSAINGTSSKADTIYFSTKKYSEISKLTLAGKGKDEFEIISSDLKGDRGMHVVLIFKPTKGRVGVVKAQLIALNAEGRVLKKIALSGLSTKGLEGENEPPLSSVFEALGYRINLGWTSLANNRKPELQGDEISAGVFKKAGKGEVKITAVARYSPDFKLPFGYYTQELQGPAKHPIGTLMEAGSFPEHQTLFPSVEGKASFNPGKAQFGFYVSGPDHSAYSEDLWNRIYHPQNTAHATRIYQAKGKDNKIIANAYFICFEEASNGDYNDYVFLVENITPVNTEFVSIFNGKNLDGWDTYLQETGNTDPDNNFRIENNALHVNGRQVGYVISQKAYSNYHLKVDFKWGEKRWPPRVNEKRDAGVCYHISPNEPDKIWQKCIEYQVQEGDVGDFWLIGNTTITVDGQQNEPMGYARIAKKKEAENPNGQWNTLEIISYDGTCVHILNGETVNYGKNASIRSGRILLQSEYAEVYYKNVKIRELKSR